MFSVRGWYDLKRFLIIFFLTLVMLFPLTRAFWPDDSTYPFNLSNYLSPWSTLLDSCQHFKRASFYQHPPWTWQFDIFLALLLYGTMLMLIFAFPESLSISSAVRLSLKFFKSLFTQRTLTCFRHLSIKTYTPWHYHITEPPLAIII